MTDHVRTVLAGQYGAAVRMLSDAIAACPADQLAAPMAGHSFRSLANHTLFFTELYLSPRRSSCATSTNGPTRTGTAGATR